jgi:ribonuclease HII
LSRKERERISEELKQTAICYAVGLVEAEEIDRINILQATKRAMQMAVEGLAPCADHLLIDAVQLKDCPLPQKAIIRGDSISASIAAASCIAKTHRDELMRALHDVYPQYDFARHVGYGTQLHHEALRQHGPCPIHRRSFRGVLPAQE